MVEEIGKKLSVVYAFAWQINGVNQIKLATALRSGPGRLKVAQIIAAIIW